MGITTGRDVVALRLSDDGRSLNWRVVGSNDLGHINIRDVDHVRAGKGTEMLIVGKDGEALQAVEAESVAERDAWVTSLTDYLRIQNGGRGAPVAAPAQQADTSRVRTVCGAA